MACPDMNDFDFDEVDCTLADPDDIHLHAGRVTVGVYDDGDVPSIVVTAGLHTDRYKYDIGLHCLFQGLQQFRAFSWNREYYITVTKTNDGLHTTLKKFETPPSKDDVDGRMFLVRGSSDDELMLESRAHKGYYLCHYNENLHVRQKDHGSGSGEFDFDFFAGTVDAGRVGTNLLIRTSATCPVKTKGCLRRLIESLVSLFCRQRQHD
ncbi:uncharacterized protein LOC124264407 [Haliotis rubra]|uniref:uncharacterized protein LOC124264407 n=1 Tax=Haliotis rubra TaxID=36100 RepID=UPI001EE5C28B|nr:uncharacterized protein LOC124264407 [Haliotis rubra]